MRWPIVALLLVGGCDRLFGLNHLTSSGVDAPSGDGRLDTAGDAEADAEPGTECIGTGRGFRNPFCFGPTVLAGFPASLTLTSIVNTNTTCPIAKAQANGGPKLCVFAADTISLGAGVRFEGAFPVVLLARSSIAVSATVDASSYANGLTGAGSSTGDCTTGTLDGTTGTGAGGGGAGGSFVGTGGGGGDGTSSGSGITSAGGVAMQGAAPMVIRGGCTGGSGGGAGGNGGPAGGGGGGALYFVARSTITIDAAITAFGGGGRGATSAYIAGAGGGAGGLIVFDAPQVTITASAILNATGGGGGEGGGDTVGGATGADGGQIPTQDTSGGGNGGTGGVTDGSPGMSISNPGGGGGGGGAGGYVGVFSANSLINSGQVRPSADVH